MLHRDIVNKLQQLTGRKFTIDACSSVDGSNAHAPVYFSTDNSFLENCCAGHHTLINPPFSAIHQFISHYAQCKAKDPGNTSAVIIVPKWRRTNYAHLLRGMQLMHEFPKGSHIFSAPNTDGTRRNMPGTPWPVQVFYDPPIQLQCNHISVGDTQSENSEKPQQQHTCLTLRALVNGANARATIDTGATHVFVAKDYVNRIGLATTPCTNKVSLANGKDIPAHGTCKIRLKLGKMVCIISAYVVELSTDYDILLGMSWFRKHVTVLDMEHNSITLKNDNKQYTIKFGTSQTPVVQPSATPMLLSALQLKRWMRKDAVAACYLVQVQPVPPEQSIHEQTQKHQQPNTSNTHQPQHTNSKGTVIQETRLKRILDKYRCVFPDELPDGLPPNRGGPVHTIPIQPNQTPPFRPMYRMTRPELEECEKQVKELLRKGLIEPSCSPYGAPVLFVIKKSGERRQVTDYRLLNKQTISNKYPMPRIDELLDQLQGAKVFSSLDLQSGYHQIRISEEDVPKTAFRTPFGHYQWRVLPFGLKNAPATFQTVMNNIFAPLIGKCVVIYLDDILIYSKTAEEHEQHLEQVLQLLEQNQLYAKLAKCQFNMQNVEFLGHMVGHDGIRPDPRKTALVRDWPKPQTITHVRSFLGLTNYFRRFVQGYSKLAQPLFDLLKKPDPGKRVTWTKQCQEAFDGLKAALTDPPVLSIPDFSKPFKVICDASDGAIGAVLLQDDKPIAYEGRRLSKTELGDCYSATDRELLAVIHALQVWRCYLEGPEFTIVSDHKPLENIDTKANLLPRQVRWTQFMSRFNYIWQYIPGRLNVADPLSRAPHAPEQPELPDPLGLAVMTRARSGGHGAEPGSHGATGIQNPENQGRPALKKRKQASNGQTGRKQRKRVRFSGKTIIEDGTTEAVAPEALPVTPDSHDAHDTWHAEIAQSYSKDPWYQEVNNTKSLRYSDGIWYKGHAIAIPKDLQQQVLQEMHSSPYAGHKGMLKTTKAVERLYWWPNMHKDIQHHVRTCQPCQLNKAKNTKPAGKLSPLPIPGDIWHSMSLDFITGLPTTTTGHDAILVFVDRLSKMAHFAPCTKETTALDTAKLFIDHVYKLHGLPREIISDRDSRFTSNFWRELIRLLGTSHKLSSAFHPETDGQTERTNRILEEYLRHYVGPTQDDWDQHLSLAEFAYNNSYQESVKATPFFLNYGRHPATPPEVALATTVPAAATVVTELRDRVDNAKRMLQSAQDRQKAQADKRRRDSTFKVNDMVLLNTKNITLKMPGVNKLLPKYIGPFKVIQQVGKTAYKLELPDVMQIHPVFHASLLHEYHSDGNCQPPPPAMHVAEDGEWFYIESLLGDRTTRKGTKQYLVKWKGFPSQYNEWKDEDAVTEVAIQEYWANKPQNQPKSQSTLRKAS